MRIRLLGDLQLVDRKQRVSREVGIDSRDERTLTPLRVGGSNLLGIELNSDDPCRLRPLAVVIKTSGSQLQISIFPFTGSASDGMIT